MPIDMMIVKGNRTWSMKTCISILKKFYSCTMYKNHNMT